MEAVAGSGAVLITGPANAKTELVKHIHQHRGQNDGRCREGVGRIRR
jgi:hypothetical protein